jgi:uncharacterized protein YcbK (DUF882 family)
LVFALTLLVTGVAVAAETSSPALDERQLRLYNTHTREHVDVVYRRGAEYVSEALSKLDKILRDTLTGEIHRFDPRLFDLLSDLAQASGRTDVEINIICGFRTPRTNEFLRAHTTGVAKNSLHMQAEAIDIRLPGLKTSKLRDIALALGRGGVGYYPGSDFIHVDVGRVRRW